MNHTIFNMRTLISCTLSWCTVQRVTVNLVVVILCSVSPSCSECRRGSGRGAGPGGLHGAAGRGRCHGNQCLLSPVQIQARLDSIIYMSHGNIIHGIVHLFVF